ncbi:hypothetical protein [Streptomyces sp. F001]|uniref:hypothetical protein n=1 Tax=Streptomyces sp. F001 TaxID=1510026 RepID=UPI00101E71AA|nr:hypothetical protein [Streptomyces sp. F001]RZB17748.1 hypothetical protein StrepF001_18145 [Streptomyces sp. F001]
MRPTTPTQARAFRVVCLLFALVFGAVTVFVMLPMSRLVADLAANGTQGVGTLRTGSGSCRLGNCGVEFQAGGERVVASLPVGTSAKRWLDGERVDIVYRADDPQRVALARQVSVRGTRYQAGFTGLLALTSLSGAVAWTVKLRRARAAEPRVT